MCVCVCEFRGVLSGQWEPWVNPTLPCVLYTRVAQRVIPEFLALEFYGVGGGGIRISACLRSCISAGLACSREFANRYPGLCEASGLVSRTRTPMVFAFLKNL